MKKISLFILTFISSSYLYIMFTIALRRVFLISRSISRMFSTSTHMFTNATRSMLFYTTTISRPNRTLYFVRLLELLLLWHLVSNNRLLRLIMSTILLLLLLMHRMLLWLLLWRRINIHFLNRSLMRRPLILHRFTTKVIHLFQHNMLLLIFGSNDRVNIPPITHISKGSIMCIINHSVIGINSRHIIHAFLSWIFLCMRLGLRTLLTGYLWLINIILGYIFDRMLMFIWSIWFKKGELNQDITSRSFVGVK